VAWNYYSECESAYVLGQSLVDLEQKVAIYRDAIEKLKHEITFNYCGMLRQVILNLMGRSELLFQLVGESFDEAHSLSQYQAARDIQGLCNLHTYKLMLCYLFGKYPEALENATLAATYFVNGMTAMPFMPLFNLYDSLTRLALYPYCSNPALDETLKQVVANQKTMQHWAHHAPMNHQHKYELIEAERCRVVGEKAMAIALYDLAISLAKENEYIQDEALANELAAKFYLDWGKEKVAASYMLEAYYCYAKWGALAKTNDLEKRYPQLLTPILQTEKLRQYPSQSITQISTEILHTSTTGTASVLDLAAVIKASQTLSREIELQQLLSTLMRVVIENAGASRGALILLNDLESQVVVSCGDAQTCILEPTPLDESHCVPLSIINRVKHTKEVLVLHAAREQSSFTVDPYLMSQRPQSLLCSPLLNQGKLLGIVYLENNLATGAFPRERVELLNLICSQAAISLQNARLYQQLEDYSHNLEVKVAERTAQLQAAQKQMVAQEKLAALGTLTAGIAHELRNPLNFVNNYAESSVELTLEVLEELENPTPDQEYIQELLTDLKDNAATIHRHGQRATNIIRSMMEHARSGSDPAQRQTTNLNQLLTTAIQLVYHSQRALDHHVNIAFETQYDDSIGTLEVMPNALSRALINLLDNACYAVRAKQMKGEPNFTPLIEIATTNCGNCIEIRLRDNGTGITSEIQEKIFEPFFTTKPTGEGTGLGLSLTHDIIVSQHGGTLSVESSLNCYTEFRITLPKVVV
jgi:signal transduction histidine kinase